MQRLTMRKSGTVIDLTAAPGKTCGLICHDYTCTGCPIYEAFKKLAEYEDAEENGMLIHLPCRVGDTVYEISRVEPYRNPAIREMGIVDILLRDDDMYFTLQDLYDEYYDNSILSTEIGKTVFLTREAAEQALKQMGE